MIDYAKFDAALMNQIEHTYEPFGFAYAIYEGATLRAHNSHGHRNQQNDTMSSHSVTEMDSMSKTVTAIAMFKLISRVPEVKNAYDAAKPTPSGSPAWSTWTHKVNTYLDHKIADLLPPRSQSGIDWNTLPAAKTITVKQLLRHTSGLENHGDDSATIEQSLQQWTATTPTSQYANVNYDLFRYIIPVFADKFVAPQPLLAVIESLWLMPLGPQLFELMIGALYAVIVEEDVMSIFPSSNLPGIQPWGDQVEFANQPGTHFWDIMNDVGPWSTLCGSWGWKMSVDQFAKLIAAAESGAVMPKEYWGLMTQSADTYDYGYAIFKVYSAFAKVQAGGSYYSHRGFDGASQEIAGQGFWLTWGPAAMCFRVNSPFKGSYGQPPSTDTDQTLKYLLAAVDTALNASLT
jgi:CubicO group peptidase (beta-lactamase class C family)